MKTNATKTLLPLPKHVIKLGEAFKHASYLKGHQNHPELSLGEILLTIISVPEFNSRFQLISGSEVHCNQTDITVLRQLSETQTFAKFSAFSDIFTKSKSQTFSQTFKNF